MKKRSVLPLFTICGVAATTLLTLSARATLHGSAARSNIAGQSHENSQRLHHTYALSLGLEKKLAARSSARLGLGSARLGSERLASLERAEPSLFSRLAKMPSRAKPARPGSRAGSRAEAKPSNQPKLPAASPPKLHSVMNFMPFSLLLHS